MNKRFVIYILGWVLILESACMLLPLICAALYGEKEILVFAVCSAVCFCFGLLLKSIKLQNRNMYAKEGLVTVSLSWIFMSIFGALPYVLSGSIPNFVNAFFETVSGFTTTGATILNDVETLPYSILFWRSFTHWIGGMGVLVFLVSILKLSGGNNLYLIKAESTGPAVGKIVPKVQSTAKILYLMYLGLTILQIILLIAGGMELFDAITLSMGTAGTGGFGIKNSSVADYTSYHQIIITIFMVLFGVDFSIYYLLLNKKYKAIYRSEELKCYLTIIAVSIVVIFTNILGMFESISEALKHAAFQVASIITSTGFATTDYDLWPQLSKTILVVLMFVGACAGSTGGGMKVSRIVIALKTIVKELKITVHPKSSHKITLNGRALAHETIRSVNVYIIAYFAIFVLSLLIISLDGFDFTSNFTAVATTINNIGPGLGAVGPTCNFSGYSFTSKIVFSLIMLIGRLEVFPMLILFSPYTWKK